MPGKVVEAGGVAAIVRSTCDELVAVPPSAMVTDPANEPACTVNAV
jgi:hypothetical protein